MLSADGKPTILDLIILRHQAQKELFPPPDVVGNFLALCIADLGSPAPLPHCILNPTSLFKDPIATTDKWGAPTAAAFARRDEMDIEYCSQRS